MCFAPYISLSTFVIEFLLAFYFLLKNPKDKLNRLMALISFLLGFYQFNEFLICVTEVNFFARFAMMITAILPAIGIYYVLIMWRKKISYYWWILIFSPSIFFITMFSLPIYYIQKTVCDTVFIQYPDIGILGQFFGLYYIVYIIGIAILFYYAVLHTQDKHEKRLLQLGMLGVLIFTVPTAVFIQFLPMFLIKFPSVLCEFALLLAIELVVLLWYKDRHNIKY